MEENKGDFQERYPMECVVDNREYQWSCDVHIVIGVCLSVYADVAILRVR